MPLVRPYVEQPVGTLGKSLHNGRAIQRKQLGRLDRRPTAISRDFRLAVENAKLRRFHIHPVTSRLEDSNGGVLKKELYEIPLGRALGIEKGGPGQHLHLSIGQIIRNHPDAALFADAKVSVGREQDFRTARFGHQRRTIFKPFERPVFPRQRLAVDEDRAFGKIDQT